MSMYYTNCGGPGILYGRAPRLLIDLLIEDLARGYVEAMMFTDFSDNDDRERYGLSEDEWESASLELSPEAEESIENAIRTFLKAPGVLYTLLFELPLYQEKVVEYGRDIWFTRQGHGAGFWDRPDSNELRPLTTAASDLKEVNVWVDDNGEIRHDW